MEFRKFQHVERLGTQGVGGIEDGLCFIFPKLDGSNGSVWWGSEGGLYNEVKCGSRNKELKEGSDNFGFREYILADKRVGDFLLKYPKYRLFGEWLIPNKLKTYLPEAWRKFYIFDVAEEIDEENFRYLEFDKYQPLLKEFELDYIQPMAEIENPTVEQLRALLDENTYLIQPDQGPGEGIVIKNYQYVNKYGRTTWAKIVRDEFKKEAQKKKPQVIHELEGGIVETFLTEAMIDKVYHNLLMSNEGEWTPGLIPRLLETVFHDFITEETFNFLKKLRNPIVNFKVLKGEVFCKVKEVKKDLF